MSVLLEKSTCVDCTGNSTCQRLKRLNPGSIQDDLIRGFQTDSLSCKRIEHRCGREEIFEIIIYNCSMKNKQELRKLGVHGTK